MRITYQTVLMVAVATTICHSYQNVFVQRGQQIIRDFYSRFNATNEVDLVFVLDRSASVPQRGWDSMLDFVRNVLDNFVISPDNTRVSIITFSTRVEVDINDLDNDDEDKCTLISRLESLVETKTPKGFTATYAALQKAEDVLLKSRKTSKKAIFILTDGKSNIGEPPVRASFDIRSLRWDQTWKLNMLGPQVEIYAFGIDNANMAELKAIAWPVSNHTFLIPDFRLFDQLARSLHGDKQEQTWEVADHFSCKGKCSTNALCTCATDLGQYHCVCKPGYHGDGISCSACPMGFYKKSLSPEKCRPCPANSSTPHTAARDVNECRCYPAFYRNKDGDPCELKYCDELDDIAQGTKFHVRGSSKDEVPDTGVPCRNTPGDSCHYACSVGYRLSGEPSLVCRPGGVWEGVVPHCTLIDCHTLEDVNEADPHSTVIYEHKETTYLSVVNVTCDYGYRPFGSMVRTCAENGIWTGTPLYCSEIKCRPLQLGPYLTVSPPDCRTNNQAFKSVCTLTCDWGFVLHGDSMRTCGFDNRWTGLAPYCRDTTSPTITCPPDLVVEAARGHDYAIVHTQHLTPIVNDNSGNVTYSIINYNDNQLKVGIHLLNYVAVDPARNAVSCSQKITVKKLTARKVFCPISEFRQDVISHSVPVTWEEPVFFDESNNTLPYECTRTSGTHFTVGEHNVLCWPTSFTDVTCRFIVNITAKQCKQPRPPLHGNVACMRPGDGIHLQLCTISCNREHDFYRKPSANYFCLLNGEWSSDGGDFPWPDCTRRFRPNRAIMKFQMEFYYYKGSCEENKEKIKESFIRKIERDVIPVSCANVLDPEDTDCKLSVDDVIVRCGRNSRKRRSVASNSTISTPTNTTQVGVNFTHVGVNSTENGNYTVYIQFIASFWMNVTIENSADQHNLKYSVSEVPYVINELIQDDSFILNASAGMELFPINQLNESLSYAELEPCGVNQAWFQDGEGLVCVDCPGGMYSFDGDCLKCPIGTYQDEIGSSECKICPANRTTATEGTVQESDCATPCPPGYNSSTGIEMCDPCGFAMYQPATGATNCSHCPTNYSTTSVGSTSLDDCRPLCEPGYYNNATGLMPCLPCPKNTYEEEWGGRVCTQCPGDRETSGEGSRNETDCFMVDYCSLSTTPPCLNRGTCLNAGANKTRCLCASGYTGERCETEIDECQSQPCLNNATCQDLVNNFNCTCSPGFEGSMCEMEVNNCLPDTCKNGGSCEDQLNTFQCFCLRGFTGVNCEYEINECASSPCVNGTCVDLLEGYRCVCLIGFTGRHCNFMIDKCVSSPCEHDGACETIRNDYQCVCLPGYTGRNCEVLVEPCASSPCGNNATCEEVSTGEYSCVCPPGFSGQNCDNEPSPDFDLVYERDAPLSYAVLSLKHNLENVLIDFWMRTTDQINYGTMFSYSAESNWLGREDNSGNTFTLTDYSQLKLYVNGEMVVTNRSLTDGLWHHVTVSWSSNGGRWFLTVDGIELESGTNLATGSFIEGGGNMILGQRQQQSGQSFNERESFIGEITKFNVFNYISQELLIHDPTCNRTISGNVLAWTDFLTGLKGDVKVRNQSFCGDDNECLFPDVYPCTSNFQCVDLVNGYSCDTCAPGYEGDKCQYHIDECTLITCDNNATCRDGPGLGDVACQCLPGFTGVHCESIIDMCESAPCLRGGICKSLINDFECTCPCSNPTPGKLCENCYGNCQPGPCQNGGQCLDHEGGTTCLCSHSFYGEYCEHTMDYCTPGVCHNNGTCVSTVDGHYCLCGPNWRGESCDIAFTPGCDLNPCINGGTCETRPDRRLGYVCLCPIHLPTHGHHCEILSPCDLNPPKCFNGATCLSLNDGADYRCACNERYTGIHCETAVYTTPSTTDVTTTGLPTTTSSSSAGVTQAVVDHCATVMCAHGGACINDLNGFHCICAIDYCGEYCQQLCVKKSVLFYVEVKLLMDYNQVPRQLSAFKYQFKKEIHQVYADVLSSKSKMEVSITKIQAGSVKVFFDLNITTYSDDGRVQDMGTAKDALLNRLKQGRLGDYSATEDEFVFRLAGPVAEGGVSLYLIIGFCVVSLLLLVAVIITVMIWRRRRKERRSKHKVTPRNDFIVHPVSNPAYIGDNLRNVELLHAHMPNAEENHYAELNDVVPYAISDLKYPPEDDYLQPMSERSADVIDLDNLEPEKDDDDYLVPTLETKKKDTSNISSDKKQCESDVDNGVASDYLDVRTPLPSDLSPPGDRPSNGSRFHYPSRRLPPLPPVDTEKQAETKC